MNEGLSFDWHSVDRNQTQHFTGNFPNVANVYVILNVKLNTLLPSIVDVITNTCDVLSCVCVCFADTRSTGLRVDEFHSLCQLTHGTTISNASDG